MSERTKKPMRPTSEAEKTLTDPRRRGNHSFRLLLAFLLALVLPSAIALPSQAFAASQDGQGSQGSQSGTSYTNKSDYQTSSAGLTITLISSTPVVTAESGFKAVIRIRTNRAIRSGTVELFTNPTYLFPNSSSISDWASGKADSSAITTSQSLGAATLPAMKTGDSRTVDISLDSSQQTLTSMTWGAKPLLISVKAVAPLGSQITTTLRTFLTRSNADRPEKDLPKLGLVFLLPVTSRLEQGQAPSSQALRRLVQGEGAIAVKNLSAFLYPTSKESKSKQEALQKLASDYSFLNLVADPRLAGTLVGSKISAFSQSDGLDINTISQVKSSSWPETGINEETLKAQTSDDLAKRAGTKAASSPIALSNKTTAWTLDSLTQARTLGYKTVLSQKGFSDLEDSTVHTDKVTVPTSAGDVTVLTADRNLSSSHMDQAMSVNKTIAYSAFYETQAPYEKRILLVNLGTSWADRGEGGYQAYLKSLRAFLGTVHNLPWVETKQLTDLIAADSHYSPDQAKTMAQANEPVTEGTAVDAYRSALAQLSKDKASLRDFRDHVLVPSKNRGQSSSANAQGLSKGNVRKDSQATAPGYTLQNSDSWISGLEKSLEAIAQRGFTWDATPESVSKQGEDIHAVIRALAAAIQLNRVGSLNAVSDKVTLPVTITNDLPFPIQVGLRGTVEKDVAQNLGISLTPVDGITVGAHDDQQVSMTVSVLSGRRGKARISLVDRRGKAFGTASSTQIIGSFAVNGPVGYAIIALAVVLGLLGAYRQTKRALQGKTAAGNETAPIRPGG